MLRVKDAVFTVKEKINEHKPFTKKKKEHLLLQYKILPRALNKNNARSRPPMAVTESGCS